MANYIEQFTSKLDWAMPFQRTGAFPLDRSDLFSSLEDARKYALGKGDDSRKLGGTSYIGQMIVVYENDVVSAYVIGADRNLQKLAAADATESSLGDLLEKINKVASELAQEVLDRKAADEALQGKIDALTLALNAHKDAQMTKDAAQDVAIANEKTRAQEAEAEIRQELADEKVNLQSEIQASLAEAKQHTADEISRRVVAFTADEILEILSK